MIKICTLAIARMNHSVLRYRLMEKAQNNEEANDGESPKRKRGRPAKGGEPILIRLSAYERLVAQSLGDGVIAQGIRLALLAAGRIGDDAVRALASDLKNKPEKVKD